MVDNQQSQGTPRTSHAWTRNAALRATADVLRHSVRKSDTVCRYGGEEFLVVLPDTPPDQAALSPQVHHLCLACQPCHPFLLVQAVHPPRMDQELPREGLGAPWGIPGRV